VLGPRSVPALIQGGYAPQDLADKRLRETEWKDLTIPHTLLVASIKTKLLLFSRGGPIKLAQWQHDNLQLWDSVETPNDGRQPIRPAAYFVLQHTGRPAAKDRSHFFLEADVGTMSHARIAQKIKAYAAYHRQQRHVAKFGMNYFQVVIVTQTRARALSLQTELHPTMPAAQRRAYHFIALEDMTLEPLCA